MSQSPFQKFVVKKKNSAVKEAFRQEKKKWKKERSEAIEKKKAENRSAVSKKADKPTAVSIRKVDKSMPLNKYVAHCGICSRRDAVEIIKEGKVKVNEQVIKEPGFKVSESDHIIFEEKRIYIQKKLVTALRIPKAYLGFEEAVGDGKNLSLLDIRFARTINRIQKSAIAEMNKIAIIHLFLMGFEDELSNFTLQLTNPSKQADLLMIDVWKEKVTLYKDMVTEIPKSIQPTSATWAKKHIFGFSDDEIKNELLQIRMERAVSAELDNTATIVTKTGIFDIVDKNPILERHFKVRHATYLEHGGEIKDFTHSFPEFQVC